MSERIRTIPDLVGDYQAALRGYLAALAECRDAGNRLRSATASRPWHGYYGTKPGDYNSQHIAEQLDKLPSVEYLKQLAQKAWMAAAEIEEKWRAICDVNDAGTVGLMSPEQVYSWEQGIDA